MTPEKLTRRNNDNNMGLFLPHKRRIHRIREEPPVAVPRQAGGDGAALAELALLPEEARPHNHARGAQPAGDKRGTEVTRVTGVVRFVSPAAPTPGGPRCRVCGGAGARADDRTHLHLQDCFGVQVEGGSAVCAECARLAQVAARYRALVLAAFRRDEVSTTTREVCEAAGQQTRSRHAQRRRGAARRGQGCALSVEGAPLRPTRKVPISCSACSQRYVMLLPADGFKGFVCSRCKKNDINKCKASKKHGALQSAREDAARNDQARAAVGAARAAYGHLSKYRCSRCPKQYSLVENLAEHVRDTHHDLSWCAAGQSLEQRLRELQRQRQQRQRHEAAAADPPARRVVSSRRALAAPRCRPRISEHYSEVESRSSPVRCARRRAMALRSGHRMSRGQHSVRFTADDLPKYKSLDAAETSVPGYAGPQSYPAPDSGAPSPDTCHFQPAAQRLRLNEQRIKLLTSINQVVQQRADLEANRITLCNLLDELRRKLRRRMEECHIEKRDKMKALKQANQRLEREKFSIMSEVEHLRRHLEREESHHVQHARTVVAQAIQGVVTRPAQDSYSSCSIADLPNIVSRNVAKNAPSRLADNKLAAARLMRDIAELRQRVAHVEARLATELKRKRQAELDIVRLRKELSATKSCVASLRLPLHPLRKFCSKFA